MAADAWFECAKRMENDEFDPCERWFRVGMERIKHLLRSGALLSSRQFRSRERIEQAMYWWALEFITWSLSESYFLAQFLSVVRSSPELYVMWLVVRSISWHLQKKVIFKPAPAISVQLNTVSRVLVCGKNQFRIGQWINCVLCVLQVLVSLI